MPHAAVPLFSTEKLAAQLAAAFCAIWHPDRYRAKWRMSNDSADTFGCRSRVVLHNPHGRYG